MRVILLSLFVILFISCDSGREFPQEVPIVITEDVNVELGEHAELRATVKTLGTGHNIVSHGFAWIPSPTGQPQALPGLNSPNIIISGRPEVGTYTFPLTSDFRRGARYTLRAFLQTDKLTIYGNPVIFIPDRVPSIHVSDFTPKSGFDETEVTITGENLGVYTKNAFVTFGGEAKAQIISASDTVWKIKIPVPPSVGRYRFYLSNGANAINASTDFTILGPNITSISPTTIKAGSTLTINGDYLDTPSLQVYWNLPSKGVYPTIISANQITVKVPTNWAGSGEMGLLWSYKGFQKNNNTGIFLNVN
jgi:hypothetical protein